jgi:predicted secreted hydrolase
VRRGVFVLALLFAASSTFAQETAPSNGFRLALPGYTYAFPRDHGSHDEFRTEWWYYTGHLEAADGSRYGFELTFFRVGADRDPQVSTAWDLKHIALAHFAITDIKRKEFRYHEKLNRGSKFTANAASGNLSVFNEAWMAKAQPDGSWRIRAAANGDAIDLLLVTQKPPAIHGENGVSVKAEGTGYASHYYSMTRLEVSGSMTVRGATKKCNGIAWMDHEFGSSTLRESQSGWDWFSIQLDNETELMIYIIRKRDGTADVTSSGSLVASDGRVMHLRRGQFSVTPTGKWRSKRTGATYPMGWRISVPALGISLRLKERLTDQELITTGSTGVTYWEGAVEVAGRSGSVPVSGVGYVEMTGYAPGRIAP